MLFYLLNIYFNMYLEHMLNISKHIGSESINIEFKELGFNSLINYFDKTVYNLLYNDKVFNSKTLIIWY